LENLFGFVFAKLLVYLGEEISDFRLCCGRSPSPPSTPQKFKLIFTGFELVSQRK
jgi:hypothetical protein